MLARMTEKHLSNQRFTEFELDPALIQGIEEAGFEYCTPIQAATLPHLLEGRDVAGQAQTGTGKTAAFLLALFQHLIKHPAPASRTATQPRALVLAPTRELAIQIDKDARLLGKYLGMLIRLVYGGTGYDQQRRDLEAGVDVLIGTPGRAIDYLKQGIYSLDATQVMVLDEADRMFDLGFIKDIRYIFRKMPPATDRLNMLFSATLSLRVNELAYEHMNNPRIVKIESENITVDQVTQRVFFPANEDKLPLLVGLLKKAGDTRTVVFMNTKHQSERVANRLQATGFKAGVLSGDVPQNKRERLLDQFKAGEMNVLVATDVAARGLHIPDVSLVVNYDLPQDPEDYVHRIGRTARAGAAGDAICFACETYAFSLPEIEAFIGQKIEPVKYDKEMLVKPGRGDPQGDQSGRRDARPGNRNRNQGEDRGRGRQARPGGERRRESKPAAPPEQRQAEARPAEPAEQPESQAGVTVSGAATTESLPQQPGSQAGEQPARAPSAETRGALLSDPVEERAGDTGEAEQNGARPGPGSSRQPGKPGRSHEIPAVG